MNLQTRAISDGQGSAPLSAPFSKESGQPNFGLNVEILTRVLEEVNHGVLLLTSTGLVCFANSTAKKALSANLSPSNRQQSLSLSDPKDQAVLNQALRACSNGRRSLISICSRDGVAVSLGVSPIDLHARGTVDECYALVILGKNRSTDTLGLQFFAQTHGLTLAETRVVDHLCVGLKATEIALQLGVACSTVRSQIRSVIQKTDAKGIRDIVSKVMLLPPMSRAIH